MNESKPCPQCKDIKPLKDFAKRQSCCKTCHAINANKYRLANPAKYLWTVAKHRAKEKQIDFNITLDDIIIPEKCPVLGIEIKRAHGHNTHKPNSPSIDRINNLLGYVKGNVRVISLKANYLKSNATLEELEKIVNDLRQIVNKQI